MSDEFYVGYQPAMPPEHARFVRRIVIGLAALTVAIAAILVVVQSPYADSRFDYGKPSSVDGVVRARPVPHLGTLLLVGEGKHGAHVEEGSSRVTGPLIERDGMRMLEVHSQERTGAAPAAAPTLFEGTQTMRGEIVDSKCWLGVMNPGEKKVHRACASLCIRGGVPPMLITRDAKVILLVEATRVLPYVAEAVEVTGQVRREDGLLVMDVTSIASRR